LAIERAAKMIRVEEDSPKGRGRPRDEEARQRILDAALEVLEEVGFAQVTTEAIAERAGASKATIYRWWPNKAAVLIEAFREAVSPELPFPDTGCARKDIQLQLRSFVNMLTGRRGRIFAAFLGATQNDAEVAAAFRASWLTPRRTEAKSALARKIERGELRRGLDLDVILDLLYGPIYYRVLTGHGPLTTEYADQLADAALRGLAPTKPMMNGLS
jgi:AcrR family transcriptional regulator